MSRKKTPPNEPPAELEELRYRLSEAEEMLQAIRTGSVDAVVVACPEGERLYTLEGAGEPYRVLIEKMNQGAATLSTGGVLLYCNRVFAGLIQTPLEQAMGSRLEAFVAPADRQTLAALLQPGPSGQSSGEVTLLPAGTTPVQVQLGVSRLPPDSTAAVCVVVTNLTEDRKRATVLQNMMLDLANAKKAVEAERQRFFGVLETLPAMICLLTPDYHVVFANRAFRERFGEAKGRRCYEYCYAKTAPCSFCETFTPLTTGRPHRYEVHAPDGSVIDVFDAPFTDADGTRMVLEMDVDITDRKRTEAEIRQLNASLEQRVCERTAALAKSEALFKAIAASTPDHLIVQDRELRYTLVINPQLGLTEQEMLGRTDYAFLAKEDADRLTALKRRVLENGETMKVEVPLSSRGGGTEYFEGSYVPRFDPEGRVDGVIGYFRNVTERKRADEHIRHLHAELQQHTAQLAATNRELETFAYSVSHDLRAPLRGIDGFSRILVRDYAAVLDETGRGHLQRIQKAAARMGTLIDDLLKLSRTARAEFSRTPIDLAELARTIATELAAEAPERRVTWHIAPKLPVLADAALMRVVLDNLLGNAWKFTGRRAETQIEFGVMERDGAPVFFVRDNGAGFDPCVAGKLFGAFQRLHTQDEFPGTGVGLATVQRIIHRHGGRVWAESAVDQGATFYFTLPDGGPAK